MGTPISAGDTVCAAASVQFLAGGVVLHATAVQFGRIESAVDAVDPTDPPTAVVVAWANGSRTTYAVVGEGATSVLYGFLGTVPQSRIGNFVQPTAASGIPNPGGRVQGPVVQQFGLQDPAGTDVGSVSVVKTPLGFLAALDSNLSVVASQ